MNNHRIRWLSEEYTSTLKLTCYHHTNILKVEEIHCHLRIMVYRLLASKFLSPTSKLLLYTSVTWLAVTYVSTIWVSAASTHIRKVIQNKILRLIFAAPWFISNIQFHRDIQIETISSYIKHTAQILIEAARQASQPISQTIYF